MALTTAATLLANAVKSRSSAVVAFDGADFAEGAISLSTRSGSAQALQGALSSIGAATSQPVAVLCSPSSIASVAEVLRGACELAPTPWLIVSGSRKGRPTLVVHVAAAEPNEATGALVPRIGRVLSADVGGETAVVLGGTDIARGVATAYKLAEEGKDVVHVYDAIVAANEHHPAAALETAAQPFDLVQPFEYMGSAQATKVFVVPASLHSANALAALASTQLDNVGVIVVRLLQPWTDEALRSAIPASAKEVHVYAEDGARGLFDAVLGASIGSGRRVKPVLAPADGLWSVADWSGKLAEAVGVALGPELKPTALLPAASKLVVVWSTDDGPNATLTRRIASRFASQPDGVRPTQLTQYDNYASKAVGIQRASLLSPRPPPPRPPCRSRASSRRRRRRCS